ncbi:junctional protein associated with coronary artery disease [Notechis scutatus]|uniref:Junctional protein associated with coronary artery disease n=1 Tax=Notechis scutatus TaxID=8663 RepID=A0A6J1UJB2_9SAUR|nr:junctional protein associated with coronary artery disease [Notechis scutatus]
MFSVDDLLISHGYKQSQNPTNSSEDPGDRDQHEDTGRQSGQAPRNGLPVHPGAIPKTNKGIRYQNNDDNYFVIGERPKNVHQEDFSGPRNMQRGLYDQSQLSRSSYSKKESDPVVWTRQGQDFIAHDYSDRVDCETREKATACALFKGENKGQWEVEELENMRSNKQETMKPPGNHRRQSLKTETWKQPTAFGQREPYIDNKESLHQDVYLERQNTVASHVKNKPQSFPGFISPENSNSAEILALASSKQHKVKPELENLKYSEPATKYGRPLKPPSYEFHQQSRGIVETNPPHEEQERRKTKIDKPGQDSTLEPPEYNPPPSYKSPGQQSKNQHVPEGVSDDAECFVKEMQVLEQSICTGTESLVNQLQMEEKVQILCSSKTQVKREMSQERHQSSVQYIPFDDPRIRHFKVIHPADHQMEDQAEDANKSSIIFCKNSMVQEFNNSHVHVPDSTNIAVKRSPVSDSSRWLVKSNADQDSCALCTQKDSYDTGNNLNTEFSKVKPYDQRPGATEVSSEILTKVKAFEPGTEIQGKNHLKKKTNETMFCLVSVPPQPELHMPVSSSETNKLYCNRHVKDQSFLSTSSSDSELQALAGNMLNKNVSEIDFQRLEFNQTNDHSGKQPPKPKKLEYSGSWPCSRYKDQQTQTSFREELPIQQPLHGSQLRKSNTLTNGHFLKYGSSTTESAPSSLPIGNWKGKPIPPLRKVQLKKPDKPECPRSEINPKRVQNELHTTFTGLPGGEDKPSFAHKEERKSPCSVKEAFGQFLLKPVSRRPWDAISELESFNKEIQKQEERREDAKENEQKHEREEKKMKKTEGKACRADDGSQEYGCGAEREIKSVPSMFKKGTNKSKPESENVSNISDTRVASSDFRNVSSETREIDKSVGLKQKQENARKIIKQAIGLHPMKSNVSNPSDSENSSVPFKSINSREASVENQKDKDSDKLKKAAGRNIPEPETAPVAPLFFKRRNQRRSEPKLRSVGLDVKEGISIPNSSTKNIPPNESLKARAARILGIEVAVESLTADNKDSESDNMAHSSELSNKKIRAEMKADMASSKGKPKISWPKSTFIGEDILGSVKEQCSGKGKLTREPSFWYHPDSSKRQEDRAYSLESAKLPLAERKSFPSNVEKKTRSTSKATLPVQGNVASAVSRAAMDRLARMKEVDSVSRMRRLSLKNARSAEDRDEDNKQVGKPEGKGSDSAVGHTEFPRKPSQGSCVSKRIISLNENEHLGNRNRKKSGRDLPSSEVYDPSRVERV